MTKEFSAWKKEAIKCIRCGACQNVCPIFGELHSEATVARGKVCLIRMLIDDGIELTDGFAELMSHCLMCKACMANCPSGVKLDKLVEAARGEVVKRRGMHPLKKLIFRVALKNRGIFNVGMKSGSLFQKILFRPGPNGQGMLPRLPMGIDKRRILKPLAETPLRQQFPKIVKPQNSKGRVAFFTGCMLNYFYVDAGRAIIEVLNKNGYEVVLPDKQHCCGTPVRVNGDWETAIAMAKANLDVLADLEVDTVITGCASCGLALKTEFMELLADDPHYGEKARKLSEKVKDFSEFVVTLDGWDQGLGECPMKVTYHDPCHLARGQGVRKQPRQIINAIPGTEFKELPRPEQCCGSAGSYSLYHYDVSKQINDKKIKDIAETDAEALVTACGACIMHMEDGLNRNGLHHVQCLHIAELLNMAYRKNEVV